jgi:ketosteroid isomerase-like protein
VSQENVDRIVRYHRALGDDWSSLTAQDFRKPLRELLDLEVEWYDQRELPGATVHRGVEGVIRHFAAASDALIYEGADLLEIIDAGESVVAVYLFRARGRESGIPVERDAVYVWSFRDTKVVRVVIFGSRAEALSAVGLEE